MKRGLLRFFCALALGLILFDNIADVAGCQDATGNATTCHACSCGSHILSQDSAPAAFVLQPTTYVAYETPVYALLLPQSIFHPPRPVA